MARVAASAGQRLGSGIAVDAAEVRVRITVWATSGTVSSRPTIAAAAA